MSLPLIQRAKKNGVTFVLDTGIGEGSPCSNAFLGSQLRIPERPLQPGEQYRFHFDMAKCIGCKCCVVACNEQNGNPADINWRRVGEIEGGWYPSTQRFHLSMGCNHCLEPSCLIGCPVNAYSKDEATGIVRHSADACIGCQYCTWNCSYGVPQYNPERGVVGKCDMCYGRLGEGREPACVNACPEGAIQIEIVNIHEWRQDYASANAPGLPSADDSISTTRITLPKRIPPDTRKADLNRVKPEDPHWPLVAMLVLTQLSVGALTTIWLIQLLIGSPRLKLAATISLMVSGLALGASTLHLGRPAFAYRALRMWKRSWLSREVLTFTAFSGVAALYAAMLWFSLFASPIFGAFTVLMGVAGMTSSAWIYRVKARPAWNSPYTVAEFFLTGAILGPLLVGATGVMVGRTLVFATAIAAGAQLLNQAGKFLWMTASHSFELQASVRLLSTVLARPYLTRGVLLVVGGIVIPLLSSNPVYLSVAFGLALAGEILGRYLFFVSVVPKNMASSYLAGRDVA
jgi:formate dehydrogenase iron-sulfur subunit